jgi:hypothetical protein
MSRLSETLFFPEYVTSGLGLKNKRPVQAPDKILLKVFCPLVYGVLYCKQVEKLLSWFSYRYPVDRYEKGNHTTVSNSKGFVAFLE